MKSALSGVIAAKCIMEKRDYNKIAQSLTEDIKQTTKFRRVANTLNNDDYDKLLTLMGLPVIKQLVYHNPFFKVTQGIRVAQIFTMFKGR
jgi:digeranylgeranylglycerophospholipid reductase